MIKSDNHVHTAFSTDSQAPMEDMLLQAIQAGFSSICFTDHMDYNFPPQDNSKNIQEFFLDTPKTLDNLYGGTYPASVWKDVMLHLNEGKGVVDFN